MRALKVIIDLLPPENIDRMIDELDQDMNDNSKIKHRLDSQIEQLKSIDNNVVQVYIYPEFKKLITKASDQDPNPNTSYHAMRTIRNFVDLQLRFFELV